MPTDPPRPPDLDEVRARIDRLVEKLLEELRQIDAEHGERRREAMARSGLPAEFLEQVLGDRDGRPDGNLLSSGPRQSTMTGTEMTSAELKKLPGEQRRRLGIAKAQSSDHPFPRALYKAGTTVTAWAAKRKLNRNIVKAWFAKGDAVRPIPKRWADEIARDYPSVPADPETVWRGGIS